MAFPLRVAADVRSQVDRAIRADPTCSYDASRAAAVLESLIGSLGIHGYRGSLGADHKPRFVMHFARVSPRVPLLAEAGVVLKVYPDAPRVEGVLQQAWRERGLPFPQLLTGTVEGCTWLLMEYIEARDPDGRHPDWLAITDQVAGLAAAMHEPTGVAAASLRQLDAVMLPRWQACVDALTASGRALPGVWRKAAQRAYGAPGGVALHGDLAESNLVLAGGRVRAVLDASALWGPPPFDAARWCARLAARSASPDEALVRWASVEPLDQGLAISLLGVECVLEAGSLEIVRRRTAVPSTSGAEPCSEDVVDDLLAIARSALSTLD